MNIESFLARCPPVGKGRHYRIIADGAVIAGFETLKEAEEVIKMYRDLQGRNPLSNKKVRIYEWAITQ